MGCDSINKKLQILLFEEIKRLLESHGASGSLLVKKTKPERLMNKFFIFIFLSVFALAGQEEQKLNYFFFIADDQYLSSIGCYNSGQTKMTSHIDAFAESALKFNRAYTPSAMCGPSRGALYSGPYSLKNGLHANHWKYKKEKVTLPNYFTKLGFESILVGKNHVSSKGNKHYKWSERLNNEQSIAGDPSKHRTFNDEKIMQRLKDLQKNKKPFMMVYGSHLPHAPFIQVPYKGFERYEASNRYTDDEFGRFLAILDELKLSENTVIIYISDHGANIPWSKWTSYNRGVQIPVLIKWPGYEGQSETDARSDGNRDVPPSFFPYR